MLDVLNLLRHLARELLHIDPEPYFDRVISADVNPLHQPGNDHLPCILFRIVEKMRGVFIQPSP